MKYGELTLGQVETIVNRLGGMEGVRRFLSDKLAVRELGQVISIDRTQPFDPVKFLGEGWSIAEEDKHSLALTEFDLTKVRLETTLRAGETSVKGEEKLKRLKKAGHIRLDANVFHTLWGNQALIPEEWKEKINGSTRYIYFDGTILRGPRGDRCVLCLYWRGGQWFWDRWLARGWGASDPSAVLASI